MSMPKHTPGPWAYDGDRHAIVSTTAFNEPFDDDVEPSPISVISTYGACGGEDVAADIALLSSAADLLAVAREMLPRNLCLTNANIPDSTVVPLDVTMGELRKIAAAIAKATGQ